MSLILDALNRADEDRGDQQNVPSFRSNHAPVLDEPTPLWKKRWFYELIAVVIVGSYIIYTLLPQADKPIVTTEAAAPAPAPAVQVTPQVTTTAQPAPQSVAAPVAVVKPIEKVQPVQVEAPTTAPAAPTKDKASASIAQLYAEPANTVAEKTAVQPAASAPRPAAPESLPVVPQELLELSRQQALANRAAGTADPQSVTNADTTSDNSQPNADSAIPLFYDLSWRTRQRVPSIDYELHMFSEKPGGSLVKINGQTRRIGEPVAPGVTLLNIQEQGIVLEHNGNTFRLDALSSWINN